MVADPNIKQLTVTGAAAESFLHKGTRRRRRNTAASTRRNEEQKGGTSPGTTVQIQANKMPGEVDTSAKAVPSTSEDLAKTDTSKPAPVMTGGEKPVKVVLAGGKRKPTKVVLAPAKIRKAVPVAAAQQTTGKTRKIAKKIRMSLGGFGKRMTRANSIRHESKKEPIERIKKTLVEAKLIKVDSKAPEDILRKMYADYLLLKNRAL
jgi:hypothetical protein